MFRYRRVICMCIYIYIYVYVCVCVCVCMHEEKEIISKVRTSYDFLVDLFIKDTY
jgi:hypothetical protein